MPGTINEEIIPFLPSYRSYVVELIVFSSVQTLLDDAEKNLLEKDTSDLIPTLDKLTEVVFKYLRDSAKVAEISSNGMYETTLPDDVEEFK